MDQADRLKAHRIFDLTRKAEGWQEAVDKYNADYAGADRSQAYSASAVVPATSLALAVDKYHDDYGGPVADLAQVELPSANRGISGRVALTSKRSDRSPNRQYRSTETVTEALR